MTKKVVIIGAGYGGLAAAATLGHKGHSVTVLEKNTLENTRVGMFEKNGYTFDTGPSWYLMPEIFDQFFQSMRLDRSNYYDIKRLDPAFRIFWEDSDKIIDVPDSLEGTVDLFESIEKGAGEKLRKYLERSKYKYDVGIARYIDRPYLSWNEVFEWDLIRNIQKFDLLTPMAETVSKQFKSPILQDILTHSTVFLGGSPTNTPGLYNLISWSEVGDGVYYPEGGFWEVTKALEKVALEETADVRYEHNVTSFAFEGDSVKKVITDKGEFDADVVIANADYHFVETQLLDQQHQTYNEAYWQTRTMSPAVLLIYFGINIQLEKLKHHSFVFNTDHKFQADDQFSTKNWPENPQYYVSTRTKSNIEIAPENSEAMMILLPIAPGVTDTYQLREKYTEYILNNLSKHLGIPLQNHIDVLETRCVHDFEDMYNAYKGNAFGLAHTLTQSLVLRPKMKSKKVDNLFYAGHYTNPGVGTPLAILSGSIVARLIHEKYG